MLGLWSELFEMTETGLPTGLPDMLEYILRGLCKEYALIKFKLAVGHQTTTAVIRFSTTEKNECPQVKTSLLEYMLNGVMKEHCVRSFNVYAGLQMTTMVLRFGTEEIESSSSDDNPTDDSQPETTTFSGNASPSKKMRNNRRRERPDNNKVASKFRPKDCVHGRPEDCSPVNRQCTDIKHPTLQVSNDSAICSFQAETDSVLCVNDVPSSKSGDNESTNTAVCGRIKGKRKRKQIRHSTPLDHLNLWSGKCGRSASAAIMCSDKESGGDSETSDEEHSGSGGQSCNTDTTDRDSGGEEDDQNTEISDGHRTDCQQQETTQRMTTDDEQSQHKQVLAARLDDPRLGESCRTPTNSFNIDIDGLTDRLVDRLSQYL